jgi:hypothetical protein
MWHGTLETIARKYRPLEDGTTVARRDRHDFLYFLFFSSPPSKCARPHRSRLARSGCLRRWRRVHRRWQQWQQRELLIGKLGIKPKQDEPDDGNDIDGEPHEHPDDDVDGRAEDPKRPPRNRRPVR